mmetsp:Transcript_8620/g.12779  ORF Transcript_8620/g.12779 Transcript_8620/m.12779 type:complete len:504 (-) Transcript_8620:77-1588(-)|eukprot:CAMPEP_0116018958 /NCGR_PEP_ID=MMETSP0321-20121206/8950_1 /TAXON_ID=163516 /ORGANISM="Leptocylindrus danicus var. danicus, Strain B650" /LENGTH=503 /DNA_ID=CAMNT_0003489435 /DNA_START=40 /DNA_END=1551 /DNA_ORIENTATION=+
MSGSEEGRVDVVEQRAAGEKRKRVAIVDANQQEIMNQLQVADEPSATESNPTKATGTTCKTWRNNLPTTCEIVTLQEWLDGIDNDDENDQEQDTMMSTRLPLVDLRTKDQYSKRRISLQNYINNNKHHPDQKIRSSSPPSTTIVNLPFETLLSGERSCELPPRTVPFAILVPTASYDACVVDNDNNNSSSDDDDDVLNDACNLFFATTSKATGQSRTPWMVQQILCERDDGNKCFLWEDAKRVNVLGETDVKLNASVAPRLWKPDPLVQDTLLPLLKERLKAWCSTRIKKTTDGGGDNENDDDDSTIMGEVWDLGSGAGRDLCFLAEELQHYYQHELNITGRILPIRFVGIDNHKGSAKRCVPMWKHRGVGDVTKSVLLNLKKLDLVQDEMAKNNVILCYAVRYLNRPLINFLASNCNEGTLFALSHFCRREDGLWNFDHPKINSVLEYGEIENIFCSSYDDGRESGRCWEVLENTLRSDADFGRTMVNFVCRRRAANEESCT